jgi:hypothetical protein
MTQLAKVKTYKYLADIAGLIDFDNSSRRRLALAYAECLVVLLNQPAQGQLPAFCRSLENLIRNDIRDEKFANEFFTTLKNGLNTNGIHSSAAKEIFSMWRRLIERESSNAKAYDTLLELRLPTPTNLCSLNSFRSAVLTVLSGAADAKQKVDECLSEVLDKVIPYPHLFETWVDVFNEMRSIIPQVTSPPISGKTGAVPPPPPQKRWKLVAIVLASIIVVAVVLGYAILKMARLHAGAIDKRVSVKLVEGEDAIGNKPVPSGPDQADMSGAGQAGHAAAFEHAKAVHEGASKPIVTDRSASEKTTKTDSLTVLPDPLPERGILQTNPVAESPSSPMTSQLKSSEKGASSEEKAKAVDSSLPNIQPYHLSQNTQSASAQQQPEITKSPQPSTPVIPVTVPVSETDIAEKRIELEAFQRASDKNTRLMQAAEKGNLQDVQTLLANGAEVNAKRTDNGASSPITPQLKSSEKGALSEEKAKNIDSNAVTLNTRPDIPSQNTENLQQQVDTAKTQQRPTPVESSNLEVKSFKNLALLAKRDYEQMLARCNTTKLETYCPETFRTVKSIKAKAGESWSAGFASEREGHSVLAVQQWKQTESFYKQAQEAIKTAPDEVKRAINSLLDHKEYLQAVQQMANSLLPACESLGELYTWTDLEVYLKSCIEKHPLIKQVGAMQISNLQILIKQRTQEELEWREIMRKLKSLERSTPLETLNAKIQILDDYISKKGFSYYNETANNYKSELMDDKAILEQRNRE